MRYFVLLFILVPFIEIAVLIQVGGSIGALRTIAIVVFTAILGTVMLRQQGIATLRRVQERVSAGQMPAMEILESVLLLIGGVLLLTPGFVTDAFGFACLVPFSRRWLAVQLAKHSVVGFQGLAPAKPGWTEKQPESPSKSGGNILDGDFKRTDEP